MPIYLHVKLSLWQYLIHGIFVVWKCHGVDTLNTINTIIRAVQKGGGVVSWFSDLNRKFNQNDPNFDYQFNFAFGSEPLLK